jgi:hypothetical protein
MRIMPLHLEGSGFQMGRIVESGSCCFPSPGVAIRGTGDVPPGRQITRAGSVWGTSFRGTRTGRNRIKRFRAGLGPGQCSHFFWRILAETFTTPRRNNLWLVQGRNQDLKVRLHALSHLR